MSIKPNFTLHGSRSLCVSCLTVVILLMSGCASEESDAPDTKAAATDAHEDGHGHKHGEGESHPETYAEAVAAIVKFNDTIGKAFAAEDADSAHGPLHDVGHILEDVNDLAEKADMTDEQREAVKGAVEKLFAAFGAVDDTMHGKTGKPYADVSAEIKESIEVLQGADATKAEETESP